MAIEDFLSGPNSTAASKRPRSGRLRVEHDAHTLSIHLSDEDGGGWTTIAVDRRTRQWAVVQDARQVDTARGAYGALYEKLGVTGAETPQPPSG